MNLPKEKKSEKKALSFFNNNDRGLLYFAFLGLIVLLVCSSTLNAQEPIPPEVLEEVPPEEKTSSPPQLGETPVEETRTKPQFTPDPSKSWRYSALIPGWGQAYNRSYWKIPIIYAGFGAIIYIYDFNNKQFHKWRNAYIAKIDDTIPDEFPNASEHALKNQMDIYRRYREYTVLAGVVLYALNIMEAYVHAHLLNFDVSEDLSLRVEPSIKPLKTFGGFASNTFGLKLTLNF